ncbi:zinc ribbon domain-containing protein [Duncaniella muris]|uniref:zinc ribbon domain-containing protein n=2 Tax=Duncaniella muris TaxID=2094150 RepID=UPI001369F7C6|nr:zinc ribbon domain-containing protein [Duncaniella muris]NBH93738.1 general stress protein [Muribaculaceae bacterium S4]NBI22051.1 general stress protein [Muribaculaceae bacterium Z1]
MEQRFCQSCGMPFVEGNIGTNSDGSKSKDYCGYCYKEGVFLQDFNMSQMIEFCTQFTDQINKEMDWNLTPQQAKAQMQQIFPTLKRWKEKDEKSLTEKATHLLLQCKEVTLASVNVDGFPRPVPLDKIHSLGCNEVWVVTAADSEKVADFRLNPKAGLSYSFYGDSVALRGTVEIITDDVTRKRMWQKYFINYFPGGPADPNYVLIHFIGKEATIWINREFAHITI